MDNNGKMRKKNQIIGILLLTIAALLFIDYHKFKLQKNTVSILYYHAEQTKRHCSKLPEYIVNHEYKELDVKHDFQTPQCNNILNNMTVGKWIKNQRNSMKLIKQINKDHLLYRKQQGIVVEQWREDGQCGYNVLSRWITNTWPQTGSFCDPLSTKPCCTNKYKGVCVPISSSNNYCECEGCVNTKNYHDALLSTWHTTDPRCQWHNYNTQEACSILNNLAKNKQIAKVLFLGDSLIRNTFMGLETILTNQNIRKRCVTQELQEICVNENMFVRRECHDFTAAQSLDDLKQSICGGQRNFDASFEWAMKPESLMDLLEKVKGKEDTYVVFGIGLHFRCDADWVIKDFLQPALNYLNYSKNSWPRIIWTPPLSIGLLKPPVYLSIQGDKAINVYTQKIEEFLKSYEIPMFDFRLLTKEVNSYDGTHYGTGVNVMKAQIILNYFATIL